MKLFFTTCFFLCWYFSFAQLTPNRQLLQDTYKSAGSDTARFRLAILISDQFISAGEVAESLVYAQHAIMHAEKLRVDTLRMKANLQIGKVCFYGGLLEKAIGYFSDCLTLAERTGNMRLMASANFNIGGAYNQLGDFSKSREYTERAMDQLIAFYKQQGKSLPEYYWLTYHINFGLLDLKEKQYESSTMHYRKAIDLAERTNSNMDMSRALSGFVDLLIVTEKYDSAVYFIDQQAINDSIIGNFYGQNISQLQLGDIFKKKGNLSLAIARYHMAMAMAKPRKDLIILERVTGSLADIYRLQKRADSALFYVDEQAKYQSASQREKGLQAIQRRELDRQLMLREKEFRKKRFRELSLLGLAVVLSLGIGAFIVLRLRKKSKLREMELSLQAEKLKLLNEQLNLKDKQLAAQVMYSLQRNELISNLVEKFQKLESENIDKRKEGLGKMLKDLEKSGQQDPWNEFEQRFQEVHAGFYERLMSKFPDLTANERRLCAFLRLDMSTKEISNLTGQSIKAITQARFRLRAKLGIENPDVSLFEVLLQI